MVLKQVECLLAQVSNAKKPDGVPVDEDKLLPLFKSQNGKVSYANGSNLVDNMFGDVIMSGPDVPRGLKQAANGLEAMGVDIRDHFTIVMDGEAVLPREIVEKVISIYDEHKAKYGTNARDRWFKEAKPKLEALEQEVLQAAELQQQKRLDSLDPKEGDQLSLFKKSDFNQPINTKQVDGSTRFNNDLPEIDPKKLHYLKEYFSKHKAGGQLYGMPQLKGLGKVVQNVVGFFVKNNPGIAGLNLTEINPKLFAVAADVAGKDAPKMVAKAISRYSSKVGKKFWQRIPELEKKGVYGVRNKHSFNITEGKKVLVGKDVGVIKKDLNDGFFNVEVKGKVKKVPLEEISPHSRKDKVLHKLNTFELIDFTENPLRGLSYYLGEVMKEAGYNTSGAKTLEKIAFVHRMGNEPLAFLMNSQRENLTFMRYTIGINKFFIDLASRAAKGDKKALGGLSAFIMMTALQTGSSSAVPVPVDFVANKLFEDYREDFAAFDDATGLNLVKHVFGTDLADKVRPLNVPAIGLGPQITMSTLKGAASSGGKTLEALSEGDLAEAGFRFLEGASKAGAIARIPGNSITLSRLFRTMAEYSAEEIYADEIGKDIADRAGLFKEPE